MKKESDYTASEIRKMKAALRSLAKVYDSVTFGVFSQIFGKYFQDPITDRLKKIDEAKAALSEAISAIDELQDEAQANSRALAQLTERIATAQVQREAVSGEVAALKSLADIDAEAVRKALRLPTTASIWRGHIFSFLLGIIGSLIASWLWTLTPWAGG